MPFQLVRDDITRMKVDAIVNAANQSLLGGGGVDGAIHAAAGPELKEECRKLKGCGTGEAKITGAYRLPCKYVIHTVGPVWEGGAFGEELLLRSCYRNSLKLAAEKKAGSLAFPLISGGVYGYPKADAIRVAEEEITNFLAETGSDMQIYLVLFDRNAAKLGRSFYSELQEFIDDNYAEAEGRKYARANRFFEKLKAARADTLPESSSDEAVETEAVTESRVCERPKKKTVCENKMAYSTELTPDSLTEEMPQPCLAAGSAAAVKPKEKKDGRFVVDEGFSVMLLRKIDERGMTDAECYKKANVDKRLFSKIRSNPDYRPGKTTVLAFAIALKLDLEETKELLMKAGYALSRSFLLDVIVEYCIGRQIYNIFDVNELLFKYDQPQLGSL